MTTIVQKSAHSRNTQHKESRARCSSQGGELGLDVCDFLHNKSVHFSVCVYIPVITAHCLRFIMHSGFQFSFPG